VSFLPPLEPTFDAALRDARAHGGEARLAAARRLADAPTARAEPARDALLVLVGDPLGPVREAAARGLAAFPEPAVVEALRATLVDPHRGARNEALVAFATVAGAEGRERLRRGLAEPDPATRCVAARAWVALAFPEPAEVLSPLLSDPEVDVRRVAVDALGEAIGAAAPEEPAYPQEGSGRSRPVRRPGGARASDGARSETAGPPRQTARDGLAERLARDPDAEVQRLAALALARGGDARGGPVLVRALREPAWAFDAAEALGHGGYRQAASDLAQVGGRRLGSSLVRAACGASLVRLGDTRGVAVLRRVLRAFFADGRSYAAAAVGELELTELAPELSRLAERPKGADPLVVARALVALAPRSATAAAALARIAARHDEAGALARQATTDTLPA
jgi:HEAT repeat protein